MKVFIAAPRPIKQPGYAGEIRAAVEITHKAGHQPFLAYEEIARRGLADPAVFMPFVRQHIHSSQLMLLLYSPELRGGLVEAGIAYAMDVTVWLMHRSGQVVSSSALGCARQICCYGDANDLRRTLSGLYQDYARADQSPLPDYGDDK
jgi:hypothetical protein